VAQARARPGGGPREERGEAHHRQPEARQGKDDLKEDDIWNCD